MIRSEILTIANIRFCSLQDAEAHGRNKKICSNVCMLESNPAADDDSPDIPSKLLRCVAATSDDAPFMLGERITETEENISFPAMAQKEMIHVPKVRSHGSVHYWNPRRSDRVSQDISLLTKMVLDSSSGLI